MNISRPFGFIRPRGMQKGYVQAPLEKSTASAHGALEQQVWRANSRQGRCRLPSLIMAEES